MNVEPSVLEAMRAPMLGHFDPRMRDLMLQVVEMLRRVYGVVGDDVAFPLQATGMSGMETGIVNLVAPGDRVVVGHAGFFGRRIAELAARHGAAVTEVVGQWGEVAEPGALLDALDRDPDVRVLAVVHGETSTGVRYPLAELAAGMKGRDTMLLVDCVTTLGAVPVRFSEWGIDFAYSCTQKALGGPPGMSPLALSRRAVARIAERSHSVPFSFDVALLLRYWMDRPPVYHHTSPILHIYALHEALRCVLAEGLEARWERHERAGSHLRDALHDRGLQTLADPRHQLPNLAAVCVPDGIDGPRVQRQILERHGIEVGGGLGPDAPAMWRIGLMGTNAACGVADRVLEALDAELSAERRWEDAQSALVPAL
jgi:alanine-glyoxylate transaminase/serine-glyoxylate transaminase/serine-pyruvate transaminase